MSGNRGGKGGSGFDGATGGSGVAVGFGGKGSRTQDLGSPHSGMKTSLTPGDALTRSMGVYKKGASYLPPEFGPVGQPPSPHPASHPTVSMIRGGSGRMKRNVRPSGGSLGTTQTGGAPSSSGMDVSGDQE